MEKEFIPYEQALELKELGFDIPSISGYSYPNTGYALSQAILYQQAFRWFMDRYNLFKTINYGLPSSRDKILFFFNIIKCEIPREYKFSSNFYANPEEAELGCLIKLIEIVKTKNT